MSKSDHRAIQTLHNRLQERFPLAFPKHYDDLRPLKIGILADVIKQLPDVDPTALRRALANHTSRDGYLLALIHGRGGSTLRFGWPTRRNRDHGGAGGSPKTARCVHKARPGPSRTSTDTQGAGGETPPAAGD
ncbi:hypothetical protein E4P82_19280 [Candidatus Competibacter phosphatis]|uniref:ProQ/FinO domain-containing protein n=1 Tax=Candidatus Competibacter phosphatis TaxID=221280 RepID=A0ABX1TT53_9GAMM|nr:hypothetical protein [Candidatus Competibacter phosphatis]